MSCEQTDPQEQPQTREAPLVSIVTIFYNRADHVRASIQSLLDQNYSNLEILALDDGSSDDTLEALRSFSDSRYRVIGKANSGFTTSLNFAISRTKGDYVAIHDAGDISLPDRISKQAEALSADPGVGLVGCWVEQESIYGGDSKILTRRQGESLKEIILNRNTFTHGEVMFRRSIYEEAGGYRPFFYFAQDRDLWIRMSRLTRHAIVPEVLYKQKVFDGGVSTTPDKRLMQAYLSDFAVQCGRSVDGHGRDLLDRYGDFAPFFRRRSPALARKLVGIAIRWMVLDLEQSRRFVEAAHAEYPSPRTYAARVIVALADLPGLSGGVRKLMTNLVSCREWLRRRDNARLSAGLGPT